ncbi:hypothetical protein T492DRAFT_832700 [Pavlovales sp. CCMP2436]|nr:hypothetical protein T492DRAFT_832700 [Pavlovales sp. CCMP2436]
MRRPFTSPACRLPHALLPAAPNLLSRTQTVGEGGGWLGWMIFILISLVIIAELALTDADLDGDASAELPRAHLHAGLSHGVGAGRLHAGVLHGEGTVSETAGTGTHRAHVHATGEGGEHVGGGSGGGRQPSGGGYQTRIVEGTGGETTGAETPHAHSHSVLPHAERSAEHAGPHEGLRALEHAVGESARAGTPRAHARAHTGTGEGGQGVVALPYLRAHGGAPHGGYQAEATLTEGGEGEDIFNLPHAGVPHGGYQAERTLTEGRDERILETGDATTVHPRARLHPVSNLFCEREAVTSRRMGSTAP